MSRFLQFAFLGCHNCYLASVTQLNVSGSPRAPSDIVCHGLPDQFSRKYRDLTKRRYIFNVRGHDFLSHVGQWTGSTHSGHLDARKHMISEIDELKRFVEASESDRSRLGGQEMLLSFGPAPGSFFADDCRTRYRWTNLPTTLEDTIQKIVCIHGYGKISDVTMNAAGGWVIQLKNGAQYEWGGQLPDRLVQALYDGKRRKASINRLYLNHQHEQEYVLIFKDGKTCICLHADFEQSFKELVMLATRNKAEWDFQQSCHCSVSQQQQINAAYYNRRGRFQLCRGAPEQALSYLKEALKLENKLAYRADYGMALIAVRRFRQDSILEGWLATGVGPQLTLYDPEDENGFRNDYLQVVGREGDTFERLSARLLEVIRLGDTPYWSYSMGKSIYELPSQIDDSANDVAELQ